MPDGERLCACGCGQSLPPRAPRRQRFIDHRHRQREYRERVRKAAETAGLPQTLSLAKVDEVGTSTFEDNGDAPARRERPKRRSPRPGVSHYFRDPDDLREVHDVLEEATSMFGDRTEARLRPIIEALNATRARHEKRRTG